MGAGSIYVPGYSLYGAPNGLSGLSCCDNSSWQTVQAQQAQLNAQLAASNAALNAMQAQLQASVNYLNQQMAQQVAGAAIIQQVGYNGMPQGTAASVQQQQQVMQAIMNVYPGASYAESAQQAYKNGEYGKATFYGTETVVDSIAALLGSKVIGAGIAGVGRLIGRGVEGVDALTRAGRAASGAESAAQGANLAEHLRQLEEYGAAGSKELQNGRIRYFDEIDAAKTPGEMAGRRVVREWARGKSMETPTRIEVERSSAICWQVRRHGRTCRNGLSDGYECRIQMCGILRYGRHSKGFREPI